MGTLPSSGPRPADRGSGVLAIGFGTTVAMWAVGYAGRLPSVLLPSPLILVLLLACLVGGGIALGRLAHLGWWHGAAAGLVTGLLNLLVLGSFLAGPSPNRMVPSALAWVPGSIVVAAILAGAGAAVGERWFCRTPPYRDWTAVFVRVAIAAALLLLGVGGLVTSTGAGLAVVDWPNSFGYNMFLYPFSRMTGGIYYEHAHRLFGALVGLTTLVLAVVLQREESRAWVRRLGWSALGLVLVQGLLGGLRVTGRLTLEATPEIMRPSLLLALVHGVVGQVFLALLVALGAFTAATWRGDRRPLERRTATTDRILSVFLVGLLLAQLALGAAQRHFDRLLLLHVAVGVAIAAPLALHVGFRAWGLNAGQRLLQRFGLGLAGAVAVQVALGLAAFAATHAPAVPAVVEVALTTLHQWFGAVVLALAVAVACWTHRLVTPAPAGPSSNLT